ncbi:uncharacterized protein PHALS_09056 [Plasmopara halstedii]|uniref:Uncharacterized protein n=1 Tax=Plasmopara halstedii TaxID=4781 RepID=A0A0P1AF36_PLAHL|nr:uncharacterized protein PHALS_09056 [Plasmopara halstedii]CEG38991.1 hypothetical protein PHALS_09056 [Plasmopara halstedii]|eukprot:XP_024575360.1 hypothetical protein PHALS_09056 [Plasmopara halstedii]
MSQIHTKFQRPTVLFSENYTLDRPIFEAQFSLQAHGKMKPITTVLDLARQAGRACLQAQEPQRIGASLLQIINMDSIDSIHWKRGKDS